MVVGSGCPAYLILFSTRCPRRKPTLDSVFLGRMARLLKIVMGDPTVPASLLVRHTMGLPATEGCS